MSGTTGHLALSSIDNVEDWSLIVQFGHMGKSAFVAVNYLCNPLHILGKCLYTCLYFFLEHSPLRGWLEKCSCSKHL